MANTDTVAPPQAIMHTPGVCGGRACVRMTRIPVWLLVQYRRLGVDDAALLDSYPGLVQADLTAAWDYHRLNTAEIEDDIAGQDRED